MNYFRSLQRWWLSVLILWLNVAFAHQEAVRVLAAFPTAKSSQVRVDLFGTLNGLAITGAIINLEIQAFGTSDAIQIIKLKEIMPGRYETELSVAPGSYGLSIVDHTFPEEALRYSFKGSLPRPANLSIASWVWAATKGRTATPASSSLILLLVVPIVITLLALIVVFFRMRSKLRATNEQNNLQNLQDTPNDADG